MRTKTGRYRWVSKWGKPVLDEAGALVEVMSGVQDIDDLMTTRLRLQATLDTEFDPHVLMQAVRDDADRIVDFVLAEVNPAACAYIGWTRGDLVGGHLRGLCPAHVASLLFEVLRDVARSGEPVRREDYAYQRRANGGGERRLDIQAARMGDGVSCTWRDVTDRYATAAALAASEESHRLLAENLSDVVMHLRDGVIASVTPSLATTLGWDPQDWLDHPIIEFIHPDDVADAEAGTPLVYAGKIDLFRVRVRARDGGHHWVQVHAKPFHDRDGNQDGIVASFRTIDPEVAVEEALAARARSDELTGLLNRREVLDRVAAMTGHARRTGNEASVISSRAVVRLVDLR
jgi:PAS domain S-box-containing protein